MTNPPVKVEPVQEKAAYDIAIPLTKPVYTHNYKRVSEPDPLGLVPVDDQDELEEPFRIGFKMEFATAETEVPQPDIAAGPSPLAQDPLASITNRIIAFAKLAGGFSDLYPVVRDYVVHRCFGRVVDLEEEGGRSSRYLLTLVTFSARNVS